MTLQEAIEILEAYHGKSSYYLDANSANAFQLGIEAMKEVKKSREGDYIWDTGLLPGETEE